MPKLKTHKGSAKRFRVTASGRVFAQKSNRRHNLEKKSPKRKRGLRKPAELSPGDSRRVHRLLPYA
ncbi:MAG: 50S ribosomal protein L35 [Clostridia bacterium]|nr:50S ribosomal protein L35 [Bacillota bacterium]MBO2522210.1 50S ribosomal protein L35 [Bacillota bacterium]